jgi:hypothetical protein
MLTVNRGGQLDAILDASIADFDIPLSIYERAVARYHDVGGWLSEYWGDGEAGGDVYAQGSFRLGTVVQPIDPRADYDIDLVCQREIAKEATTQAALKRGVGAALGSYAATGPEGQPGLAEGKRCWTLNYRNESFHMDVLPAIPDKDAAPTGILLTDRELRLWQHSNPMGYADWFELRMASELQQVRAALAEAKQMDVADVPAWYVKTTLQRTVQALKRHRDLSFVDRPDDRPASIIISTLAARAYSGSGSLYDVLIDVTAEMPRLVERRDGLWWVPNPVQPAENFADRWRTNPGRDRAFFEWIEQAHRDFVALGAESGVDRVLAQIGRNFGDAHARHAGAAYGTGLADARDRGGLGLARTTGMLVVPGATAKPIPAHTFHGDPPFHRT